MEQLVYFALKLTIQVPHPVMKIGSSSTRRIVRNRVQQPTFKFSCESRVFHPAQDKLRLDRLYTELAKNCEHGLGPKLPLKVWPVWTKIAVTMNDLEELERRLRLSMLKAQLALREMERTALTNEIESPLTTPERKAQAIARRDASLIEWAEIMNELGDSWGVSELDREQD